MQLPEHLVDQLRLRARHRLPVLGFLFGHALDKLLDVFVHGETVALRRGTTTALEHAERHCGLPNTDELVILDVVVLAQDVPGLTNSHGLAQTSKHLCQSQFMMRTQQPVGGRLDRVVLDLSSLGPVKDVELELPNVFDGFNGHRAETHLTTIADLAHLRFLRLIARQEHELTGLLPYTQAVHLDAENEIPIERRQRLAVHAGEPEPAETQLDLFRGQGELILDAIRKLDLDRMTPLGQPAKPRYELQVSLGHSVQDTRVAGGGGVCAGEDAERGARVLLREVGPAQVQPRLTVAGLLVGEVVDLTLAELAALRDTPVGADELRRAKDHLKGSLMLSLESTSSRMSHLARQEMYRDSTFGLDEMLNAIEQVSAEDVLRLADRFFSNGSLAVTVGVYTNNTPSGAFRSFGALQSQFATESHLDICAEKLGLDRTSIHRKMKQLGIAGEGGKK